MRGRLLVVALTLGALVVSPTHARSALTSLVDDAERSIDIEDEEFSDSTITDRLVAKAEHGVAVRLVLSDYPPSSAQSRAVWKLESAGVSVVTVSDPTIHAKAMVVDGERADVGSENLTANSRDENRELGVILRDATAVATVSETIEQDFADGVRR